MIDPYAPPATDPDPPRPPMTASLVVVVVLVCARVAWAALRLLRGHLFDALWAMGWSFVLVGFFRRGKSTPGLGTALAILDAASDVIGAWVSYSFFGAAEWLFFGFWLVAEVTILFVLQGEDSHDFFGRVDLPAGRD